MARKLLIAAKWACAVASLLFLMVWVASPASEFDVGSYSVRVKDGNFGIRTWGIPRAEYEKNPRESHGGPDTRAAPLWFLVAIFGVAAWGLWRWTGVPNEPSKTPPRPTCPTCHRELA